MQTIDRAHVRAAEQALVTHRRDGTGFCGSPTPCDAMLRASQLHEHYRARLNGPGGRELPQIGQGPLEGVSAPHHAA